MRLLAAVSTQRQLPGEARHEVVCELASKALQSRKMAGPQPFPAMSPEIWMKLSVVSCFFLIIGIVVVFFVFAIILRGSGVVGEQAHRRFHSRDRSRYPDEEDEEEEDWDAYAHPPRHHCRAIPEPGVFRGVWESR